MKPAVFDEQCDTCVFRPGNPMRLAPGRLREIVRHNLAEGAALICHTTTHGRRDREVVCRGWWDRYRDRTTSIVVVGRLAAILGQDGDGFEHVPYRSEPTPSACSITGEITAPSPQETT